MLVRSQSHSLHHVGNMINSRCVHPGADVKIELQPKMAWGEIKEEAPQCSGPQPQLRNESGTMKMPPLNKSLEEPKVAST